MATKSIGRLYAEITANASQFINEFKRADNEARRSSAQIRATVNRTMRDVGREFSLPKLAKGFMGGLGIGGGVQVMGMATDKLAELFQSGAKHAEDMAAHVAQIREDLTALHDKRFAAFLDAATPGAKPGIIEREIDRDRGALAKAQAQHDQAAQDMQMAREGLVAGGQFNPFTGKMSGDPFEGRFEKGKSSTAILSEAQQKQGEAIKEMERLKLKIAELSAKHADATKGSGEALEKSVKEFFNSIDEAEERVRNQSDAALKERRERFNKAFNEAYNNPGKDPMDSPQFKRLEQASQVQVDSMTRRGMGSGANYAEIGKTTNQILSEMLSIIRTKAHGMRSVYAD